MGDQIIIVIILAFPFIVLVLGMLLIGTGEYDAEGELVNVHPGLFSRLWKKL